MLRGLVEQYAAEKDPSKRGQIFESLVQKWAGVDGVAPGSRGGQMDARQLAFLEKFFGENFNGVDGPNPNNTAAPILKELYTIKEAHTIRALLSFYDRLNYLRMSVAFCRPGSKRQ